MKHAPSQATRLVDLAESVSLWSCASSGEAFASFWADNHLEHWPIGSRAFQHYLARLYFEAEQTAPSPETLRGALQVLEGRAQFEGKRFETGLRVGGALDDGLLYLDLADGAWNVVEINAYGWKLISSHDCSGIIRFRRSSGMRPLPLPERCGSIEELRDLLNIDNEADFSLIVGWLIGALRPAGPYPLLALHGEQGSGKSGTARLLRNLIDPCSAPIRSEPRDERDLMIAARNRWIIALDNLSHVRDWLSDALCRLASDGGFGTRSLYSDAEEMIFESTRPMILTGISELAERSDLLDRTIVITLPRLADNRRRTEADLATAIEESSGRILGALLNAVAEALRNEQDIKLPMLPRMADFARWVAAAEPRLPWLPGSFLSALAGNRAAANETALDASAVGLEIRRLLAERESWRGTATELFQELERRNGDTSRRPRGWPRSAKALSGDLRRLAPNLRLVGLGVEFEQTRGEGSRKLISLRREASSASDACDAYDARPPLGVGGVAGVARSPLPEEEMEGMDVF